MKVIGILTALILGLTCAFGQTTATNAQRKFTVPPQEILSPRQSALGELNRLKNGDWAQQRTAIHNLHHLGKEAIPVLIENLDDKSAFYGTSLLDPKLSVIPPDSLKKSYRGILYAYVIELILGKASLNELATDDPFLLDVDDYVYRMGLLKSAGETVRPDDLKDLKSTYEHWWEAHKQLSLEELRNEWMQNKRPLSGTKFHWI